MTDREGREDSEEVSSTYSGGGEPRPVGLWGTCWAVRQGKSNDVNTKPSVVCEWFILASYGPCLASQLSSQLEVGSRPALILWKPLGCPQLCCNQVDLGMMSRSKGHWHVF